MQYLTTSKYQLPPSFFGDPRRHHVTKLDFGRRQNARSAVMILLVRRLSVSSTMGCISPA